MTASALAVLFTTDNDALRFTNVYRFSFSKDKYTPYSQLDITLVDKDGVVPLLCTFKRITFMLNEKGIHDGLIDHADFRTENGVSTIHISSRGFTSLLLGNQMVPGMHYDMSINKLMESYYEFPFPIRWKSDITTCNYIYVKPHCSMWDSVINLGYKLYGCYPYVRYPCEINISPHSEPKERFFSKGEYLSAGWCTNAKNLLSDLHMQDIDGNYEVYNLHNDDADDMLIVRHKQISFDMQYLDEPERSLELTFGLSSKGWRSRYVTISGFEDLDIYDLVSAEDVFENSCICAVDITGSSGGVKTTYTAYLDNFTV